MLELWGGHECTVNRVGDRWRDQTRLTGHEERIGDLARFAALGVRRLRYPALWERIAPDDPQARDWTWTDERFAEIARLGMAPIAGLLHHGSGPRYTSLVHPDFVPKFRAHARAVAERYPWIDAWTPVNEPLTTARFSCLYGLWFPHARGEAAFWAALLNQVEGVQAAMSEVRAVNPAAILVQTEDLGEVLATPPLAAEAERQNHRRWLTWDLLCGRVTSDHPLWADAVALGFQARLERIAEAPCPPDVIGVNHYLTSVRFLDHRANRYPPGYVNREGHVDVEAIRVVADPPPDLASLLRQTWDRYRLPIAVTESHNACTRDEQMRWTFEAWVAALALRREGIDVRAVTPWALAGACDWDSLLTLERGHREAGAFDLKDGALHETPMTDMLRRLGRGEAPAKVVKAHPELAGVPWWRRDDRLIFPPHRIRPPEVARAA